MKQNQKKPSVIRILITGSAVLVMMAVCMVFTMRPTVSVTEKRKLAEFPKLSFTTLFNGEFFSDVSLWFSDTVPFRDSLTSANGKIQHFLGTSGALNGFNEGPQGDDIPDPVQPKPVDKIDDTTAEETSAEETNEAESTEAVTDDPNVNYEALGNILVCGNAGYEYYNFIQSAADNYISDVNRAASKLNGISTVYDIAVPTSMGITLNLNVQKKVASADQHSAVKYILGSMASNVKTVNIYDTLMAHRDEYIYFRTDHHWTALGAYYAYIEFCAAKGIQPLPLDRYTVKSFDGLLGTFYSDSGNDPALGATPDRVDTYTPPCSTKMLITDTSGSVNEYPMIYDESNAPASLKYGAFIAGDNPLTVIENLDKTDGESCIVVKESFGNCFVPFLTYHYKYVYVIDYRYYNGTICGLAQEKNVDDVIFINNLSMIRAQVLVDKLTARIG